MSKYTVKLYYTTYMEVYDVEAETESDAIIEIRNKLDHSEMELDWDQIKSNLIEWESADEADEVE